MVSRDVTVIIAPTMRVTKTGSRCLCSSWYRKPISIQSYGASPAIWDHTALPVTQHRWTRAPFLPQPSKPLPDLLPPRDVGLSYTHRCHRIQPGNLRSDADK